MKSGDAAFFNPWRPLPGFVPRQSHSRFSTCSIFRLRQGMICGDLNVVPLLGVLQRVSALTLKTAAKVLPSDHAIHALIVLVLFPSCMKHLHHF